MRIAAVTLVLAAAATLPIVFGPRLRAGASPAWLVVFGATSLVGLAAGTIAVLAALIDPGVLPASTLPRLVDRCMGAARDILSHPVQHWPKIAAAVLIALLLGRLMYSLVLTISRMRGVAASSSASVPAAEEGIEEIASTELVAMTVGILRRRIVISSALSHILTPSERAAVIAHERAHINGHHSVILLLAQSLVHAFGRIPPVRESAACIVTGLELAADDAAVLEVGDPLVVARALERVASARRGTTPATALAAADTEVGARAQRLCAVAVARAGPDRLVRGGVAAVTAAVVVVSLAVLPVTAMATPVASRESAVHDICHLPH